MFSVPAWRFSVFRNTNPAAPPVLGLDLERKGKKENKVRFSSESPASVF